MLNSYDKFLFEAEKQSTSMCEFYTNALENHYANCTLQAAFLANQLNQNCISARVFSLGISHDFVIAKNEVGDVIISDPWADIQLTVNLPQKINHID